MDENFEAPPMGGENVPFRELPEEKPPIIKPVEAAKQEISPSATKEVKKLRLIMIGLIVFMLFIIIMLLGLLLKPKPTSPPPLPSPSPSPSPVATPSAVGRNVVERVNTLEKQIDELDFTETNLSFPILDFNINFEKDQ